MCCVCLFVGGGCGEGSREGIVCLYNLSNSPMLISEEHPQYIWISVSLGCLLLTALAPVRIRYKGCFAGIPYTWYFWGWCVPHQATLPRASLYGNNITLQGREVCSLPLAGSFLSRECLGWGIWLLPLEKVEMKVKVPPTSLQDIFNRPPKSFSNPSC